MTHDNGYSLFQKWRIVFAPRTLETLDSLLEVLISSGWTTGTVDALTAPLAGHFLAITCDFAESEFL